MIEEVYLPKGGYLIKPEQRFYGPGKEPWLAENLQPHGNEQEEHQHHQGHSIGSIAGLPTPSNPADEPEEHQGPEDV